MSMYLQGTGDDALAKVAASFVEEARKDEAEAITARIAEDQETAKQDEQDEANPLVAAFRKFDKKLQAHASSKAKAKEAKLGKKKLLPPKEIDESAHNYKNNHPEFLLDARQLSELIRQLPEEASQEEILKVIHAQFTDAIQASIAWKFVESLSIYDKETMESVSKVLNHEVLASINKREQEVAQKTEEEANAVLQQNASATAFQIIRGGDLNKLLEHLMVNPIEAPAIFKMLDDSYGKDLKKIESYLLKKCGLQINKLIALEDHEDIAHMKNAMVLIKKLQAIIWVDRFFENRNKPN